MIYLQDVGSLILPLFASKYNKKYESISYLQYLFWTFKLHLFRMKKDAYYPNFNEGVIRWVSARKT